MPTYVHQNTTGIVHRLKLRPVAARISGMDIQKAKTAKTVSMILSLAVARVDVGPAQAPSRGVRRHYCFFGS
jgi:hypothetical protein